MSGNMSFFNIYGIDRMGALGPRGDKNVLFCLKTGHRSLQNICAHLPRDLLTVALAEEFTQWTSELIDSGFSL